MRVHALLAGVAGSLTAFVPSSAAADAHPYFADRGALSWTTCVDRAQTEAKRKGRLILVEYGRRECRSCRVLVEQILPNLKERLDATCIGLAADCDEPDPRVQSMFSHAMPGATRLPFVALVTPDLKFVTGWDGSIGADEIVRHLDRCQSALRALPCAARAPIAPPRPTETHRPSAPPAAPASVATTPQGPGTRHTPARADGGLPVGPTAPGRVSSAMPTAWTAAHASRAIDLLAAARSAAARGAHTTVLALEAQAARLPVRADPATWQTLVAAANDGCEQSLNAALAAAKAGRCDEASRLLATLRAAGDAGGAVADDIVRGERAVDLARRLESTPTEQRLAVREVGRTTFARTRWAALFQS